MLENTYVELKKVQYPQKKKRVDFRSMKVETKFLRDILSPTSNLVL